MIYSEENLRSRLDQLSPDEMIDLLVRLYKFYPEVQSAINQAVITIDSSDYVLSHMEDYSPGECKTALAARIRTIKDRKQKVLTYFDFIEWILDRKEEIDFRFISVASASFGKAMTILGKDRELWNEMLERSDAIAGRFYEMDGAVPYKAVEYYMRTKRSFDE